MGIFYVVKLVFKFRKTKHYWFYKTIIKTAKIDKVKNPKNSKFYIELNNGQNQLKFIFVSAFLMMYENFK